MRNPSGNFIPIPTKPAKSVPKPRVLTQRKSSSCQTERVVLIKEENLIFHPCTRFSQNDGGMRRDYVKAINYINSCHKFINTVIEKNTTDKSNMFLLPMMTNFIPLFSYLIGKKNNKAKEKVEEVKKPVKKKSEERKSKSSFRVKKVPQEEPVPDPAPVGDCGKDLQEEKYVKEVADIVKEQIQQFLGTLQEDMEKAVRKSKSEPPKQKCKNLDIVKQRLEELSKICFLQRNMESNSQVVEVSLPPPPSPPPSPPPNPPKDTSEECSVIVSDTDNEEARKHLEPQNLKITCYGESASSLLSDSSEIKSDSEIEINV